MTKTIAPPCSGFFSADTATVAEIWSPLGIPTVSIPKCYRPEDVEALGLNGPDGRLAGLVTWVIDADGQSAEIVTLDAFPPSQGYGSELLLAAEKGLAHKGVRRVWLLTSNDNYQGLGFYQRKGYRLIRLHLDAMDRVRSIKPHVPLLGKADIPLEDLWELEKSLS